MPQSRPSPGDPAAVARCDLRRPLLDSINGHDQPSGVRSSGVSARSSLSGESTVIGTETTDDDTVDGGGLAMGWCGVSEGFESRNRAKRAQEGYWLQLTLARRVTDQAFLADQPLLWKDCGKDSGGSGACSDPETVSYRLWVNGCLSYYDKITNGLYNILGMDPFLWAMCNESEEGRRMPTLSSLREVDPCESSLEVLIVDKHRDPGLKQLEDKALEISFWTGITIELVENLAKLVSNFMGGCVQIGGRRSLPTMESM